MTPQDDLSNVYFVWADTTLLGRSKGPLLSYSYPIQRDANRSHTLEWFKQNHPEWVTYKCDKQTPSYGYVYGWGAYMPIDTTNMEVRRYLLNTYLLPAIERGYRVIGFDNATTNNTDHRCGVWQNGHWKQLYGGETRDPAAYVSLNHVCGDTMGDLTREDADFIVASFLVNRSARSYLSVFAVREVAMRKDSSLLHADLGKPTGEAIRAGPLLWRPHERGLAAVNPSSSVEAHFVLPPGRWERNGKVVDDKELLMPPRSGLILRALR